MVTPWVSRFLEIIVLFFEKFLQGLDCPRMQPASPALRLPDFGASLFERLVLKVVTLQKFSLFFGQVLDGRPNPPLELLNL